MSNGGYATYFQSTEDTASIRHAVMHIKIALTGQAQESALNLPLNVLEARTTSFGQAEIRQLQGNMGTDDNVPTPLPEDQSTRPYPASESVNELVKHYRDQSAAFADLQRDVQKMTDQMKLHTEVHRNRNRTQGSRFNVNTKIPG